ncbi:MAG: NAD(P)H nitroreductase, partial [Mycobacterium sp.]
AGMATCTLTHLIEVDESRDIVRTLIDHQGQPQLVIRAGIAPPMEGLPAPTPRSPLDDVFQIR